MLCRLSLILCALALAGNSLTASAQSQDDPPLPQSPYATRAAFVAKDKGGEPAKRVKPIEPTPTAEPQLTEPPSANPTGDLAAQLAADAAPDEPATTEETHTVKTRALPLPSQPKLSPDAPRKAESGTRGRAISLPSITTVLASLAIVVGLFLLLAWMLRRSLPRGSRLLPGEAVEVLGRTPLAQRQFMHLLRVGNKLLLVSVSSAGVEPLTEITDPVEVDRLAGLCKQSHPHSSTNAFRQVFQQFGNQNAAK